MMIKKTLSIYDFDDTLFKSDSCVMITSKNLETKFLHSHEYSEYVPMQDDILDFSEFEVYPKNPTKIDIVVDKLKKDVKIYGIDNVIILTARRNNLPIQKILKDFELPDVRVIAAGSSASQAKTDHVCNLILTEKYEMIILHEDNLKNINEIKNMTKKLIGDESFIGYKVLSINGLDVIEKV